jgi:hypothetical protein
MLPKFKGWILGLLLLWQVAHATDISVDCSGPSGLWTEQICQCMTLIYDAYVQLLLPGDWLDAKHVARVHGAYKCSIWIEKILTLEQFLFLSGSW